MANRRAIAVIDALDSVQWKEGIQIVQQSNIGRGLYGWRVKRALQLCDAMAKLGIIRKMYNLGRIPQYRKLPMNRPAYLKILEDRKCQ